LGADSGLEHFEIGVLVLGFLGYLNSVMDLPAVGTPGTWVKN
jgi:hypothetical protein